MKYKVAFLGTPKFAAQILSGLAQTDFAPQLVITGHDQKSSRGLPLKATDVKLEAQKQGITISYELGDIDKSFDLAILAAYGKIIPDEILSRPKYGFVNVHPSLLPKYRGASPITSAILNGDNYTGVTLIVLDSELDHGPQIDQQELEIAPTDTYDSLTEKLASIGPKLLLRTLPQYLAQNITPEAQKHELATYTEKITKESGRIDLENPPDKKTLDRMIRAYYPWPGVWAEVETPTSPAGKQNSKLETRKIRIKLLPIKITDSPTLRLTDSPFLIQPEGKRPMTIKEFKNGYRQIAEKLSKIY